VINTSAGTSVLIVSAVGPDAKGGRAVRETPVRFCFRVLASSAVIILEVVISIMIRDKESLFM
jgi:hypothetical protein